MQNNINNNNEDKFSELLKQKLEFHASDIEAGMWDELQKRLPASKNKKRVGIIWWSTLGFAATVALILSINSGIFLKNDSTSFTQNKAVVEKKNDQNNQQLTNNKTVIFNTTEEVKSTEPLKVAAINNKKNQAINTQKTVSDAISPQEEISEASPVIKTTEDVAVVDSKSVDNWEPAKTITENDSSNTQKQPKLELRQNEWSDPLKSGGSSNWELIAMAGSNSSTNSLTDIQLESMDFFSPESEVRTALSSPSALLNPSYFDTKNYFAPISVGFSVGYSLKENFSISSGLVYSYLLSTFSNSYSDARLHLHYLGIPIRLNYQYAKTNKMSFYISGGGMLEKGLWQLYVQNQYSSSRTYTTRINDKIAGLQWSLQASTGFDYEINKKTALYFEPKLIWYFDNNQPISIRTESKFSIGFEAGLKYNL